MGSLSNAITTAGRSVEQHFADGTPGGWRLFRSSSSSCLVYYPSIDCSSPRVPGFSSIGLIDLHSVRILSCALHNCKSSQLSLSFQPSRCSHHVHPDSAPRAKQDLIIHTCPAAGKRTVTRVTALLRCHPPSHDTLDVVTSLGHATMSWELAG